MLTKYNITFWQLAFIFEFITLFSLQKINSDTTSTQIEKRLHLFRIGNITKLYYNSINTKSCTLLEKWAIRKNEHTTTIQKYAQLTPDNNNFRSAIDRITSGTPTALNTPEVVDILKSLYPLKHILSHDDTDTIPTQINNNTNPLTYIHS